jgi:hypothetical protein
MRLGASLLKTEGCTPQLLGRANLVAFALTVPNGPRHEY